MATARGQEFIRKYKNNGVDKSTWLIMYKKGHITLQEFTECADLTEEEKARYAKENTIIEKTTEEKLEELIQQVSAMDEIIANLTLEVM